MPISGTSKKSNRISVVAAILVLVAIIILSFIQGGRFKNTIVFATLAVTFIVSVVHSLRSRALRRSCNVYTKGEVIQCETKGKYCYLTLAYSVMGSTVQGKVQYYEKQRPSPHASVGVYYNEHHPTLCMLKAYKNDHIGFSSRTWKQYRSGLRVLAVFGLFCICLGAALVGLFNQRTSEYSAIAEGCVVDYDVRFDSHTPSTPGTYEYTPIIQFEYEGSYYEGKALQLYMHEPYDIGEYVEIQFDPVNPSSVIIRGDNTVVNGGVLFVLAGIAMIFLSLHRAIHRPKYFFDPDNFVDIDELLA